ncbi:MAG: hypothetical protein HY963_07910 [Ignavibacteriales bacterium]|nr:hypothetical protein [Ignavibacteriales bacterium]
MIRKIEPLVEVWNVFGYQNISQYISSVRIQNSVDTPVGVMTLVINPSATSSLPTSIIHNAILNEAQKRLELNSIVSAKIDKNSEKHSFLGRIDNIYPRISADGNNTQRELVVNCSMLLPKILIRDEIINFPLLQYMPGAKEKLGTERVMFLEGMRGNVSEDKTNVFQGSKPEDAVKWIIENCIATNTTVTNGRTRGGNIVAKSFFNPKKAATFRFRFLLGEQLYNPILSVYAGPLLSYIISCIDVAFYEIFFDTETGEDGLAYNVMTVRPKPFSFVDYKPQHSASKNYNVITGWVNFDSYEKENLLDNRHKKGVVDAITKNSEQRLTDTTGISDYELKNSFSVTFQQSIMAPANSLFGQLGPLFPLLNFDSIKRYGLRHLQLDSTVSNYESPKEKYNRMIASKTPQDLAKIMSEPKGELEALFDKREKVFEWYAYPYFESGSITWVGDENLKVGQRLIYEDKEFLDPEEKKVYHGVEYYINSIAHEFAYGRFFRTTTELSRGAPKGLAAKWLNKNRADFISPTELDYDLYMNKGIRVDKVYERPTMEEMLQNGLTEIV